MNSDTGDTADSGGESSRASRIRFYRETGLAAEIAGIVEPVIEGLGYRLVRVQISGQEGQTIQIMAERPDGTMAIEDCEAVSRDVAAVLDAVDPVKGAYRLEVSSPGIDRPLVRPSDFEDWSGFEARIELSEAVSGRKRWRGILEGIEDGEVRVECEIEGMGQQTVGFPIGLVAEAKLVLTDELVREALRGSKRGDADVEETLDGEPAEAGTDDASSKPGKTKQATTKRAGSPGAKKDGNKNVRKPGRKKRPGARVVEQGE